MIANHAVVAVAALDHIGLSSSPSAGLSRDVSGIGGNIGGINMGRVPSAGAGSDHFADVGALAGSAVAAADPAQRGAALALYALAGFTTGFLGPWR